MRADQCLLKSRCHDARRVGRRATRRRQHRSRYRARSYQKKGPRGGRVVRSEDSRSRLEDAVGAVPGHRVPSHRRWALTRPSVYQQAPTRIIARAFIDGRPCAAGKRRVSALRCGDTKRMGRRLPLPTPRSRTECFGELCLGIQAINRPPGNCGGNCNTRGQREPVQGPTGAIRRSSSKKLNTNCASAWAPLLDGAAASASMM